MNQALEKAEIAAAAGLKNDNATSLRSLAEMDRLIETYMKQSVALGDKLFADTVVKSERLSANTRTTILSTLVGTLVGMGVGIAVALYVSAAGITGPLGRLGRRMSELAGGRLDMEIDGQDRRDEVGRMAAAVQVFKDAAVENKRLEAEAATGRQAQEAQRDRQSAIDNAKAEDLRVFVHAVEAGFNALASGNLTIRMTGAVAPEFEPIRAKFNDAVASLDEAVGSVVGAVGTIRVGLGQITVAAGDLSQRTEQQAASLEETVAALSEVTRGVNDTATNASQAQADAQTTRQIAEKGGAIVAKAVAAMSQIEESSEKIGRIIGVIDEIAFQTNLLALNAGVEAARAGEAGRGFAVVAQEVRGLAQRSAEAAKEIKSLISTSSAQVGEGVELVTASGRSLDDIVAGVGNLANVVATIAHSAREQAGSLREVSTAADQMDKATQQNAAMVEETTAAAQSLSGETEELAGQMERFQTRIAGERAAGNKDMAAKAAKGRTAAALAARAALPQMRQTGGGGGAARKAAPAPDDWQDF